MMFTEYSDGSCPECGGSIGTGLKDEGGSTKVFVDCFDGCGQLGMEWVSGSEVDAERRGEVAERFSA